MLYKVAVVNDMGHYDVKGDVPRHIRDYVFAQAPRYMDEEIRSYSDRNYSTAHYHLKPGFQTQWKYRVGNDIVEITWPIRTIDESTITKQIATLSGWTIISTLSSAFRNLKDLRVGKTAHST
jgi:hypothetical protein